MLHFIQPVVMEKLFNIYNILIWDNKLLRIPVYIPGLLASEIFIPVSIPVAVNTPTAPSPSAVTKVTVPRIVASLLAWMLKARSMFDYADRTSIQSIIAQCAEIILTLGCQIYKIDTTTVPRQIFMKNPHKWNIVNRSNEFLHGGVFKLYSDLFSSEDSTKQIIFGISGQVSVSPLRSPFQSLHQAFAAHHVWLLQSPESARGWTRISCTALVRWLFVQFTRAPLSEMASFAMCLRDLGYTAQVCCCDTELERHLDSTIQRTRNVTNVTNENDLFIDSLSKKTDDDIFHHPSLDNEPLGLGLDCFDSAKYSFATSMFDSPVLIRDEELELINCNHGK